MTYDIAKTDQEPPRRCIVCRHGKLDPTELQTCIVCLGTIRRQMTAILDKAVLVSVEIAERAGTATPMDQASGGGGESDPIPGGDALVMLAGGSGLHHFDERTQIDSLVGMFARWEDDWRVTFEVKANRNTATLANAMAYLLDNLTRAAQRHPTFNEFAKDVHTHHEALRQELREGDPADKAAIVCPTCGGALRMTYRKPDPDDVPPPTRTRVLVVTDTKEGRIERLGWTPSYDAWRRQMMRWNRRRMRLDQGGRRDEWHCTRCPETLTAERYAVLVHQAADQEALPAKDIALLLGVSSSRVRQIVGKHKIEPVHSEGKVPYYRVDDVRGHARARRSLAS